MDVWYQCCDCKAGSNSKRNMTNHAEETGHEIREEES
jgi:hypothetical protein